MSNRLVTWARNQTVGDAQAKFVLVLLADQALADGSCWPSHKSLSEDTEIPRRTLQRKLKEYRGEAGDDSEGDEDEGGEESPE